MDSKLCYLFVGNPGVGKSTLINGVIGKPVFKAGTSLDGSGLTFQFDQQLVPGLGLFMDTPGLADEKKKQQAADAITQALKQDGFYRLFFVMTQEEGRIRPQDKTTMQLILEAAPTITDYSVIVNKVSSKWHKRMTADPEQLKRWVTSLMSDLPVKTVSIQFMHRDDDLEGEDDVEYQAPADIINFIKDAPGMNISSCDVQNVAADRFEAMQAAHEQLLQRLEEDKAEMKRQIDIQAVEMDRAVLRAEQAQAAAERARQEAGSVQHAAADRFEAMQAEHGQLLQRLEEDKAEMKRQMAIQAIEMDRAALRAEQAQAAAARARQEAGSGDGLGRVIGGIFSLGLSEVVRAVAK